MYLVWGGAPGSWGYLVQGVVPGPRGCTWSQGVYLVPGGVPGPGGIPGPGGEPGLVGVPGVGVYLVPRGCVPGPQGWYLLPGDVPGPRGCTWSWGVYLVQGVYLVPGGVPGLGGVPGARGCTWSQGGVPGPGGGGL